MRPSTFRFWVQALINKKGSTPFFILQALLEYRIKNGVDPFLFIIDFPGGRGCIGAAK